MRPDEALPAECVELGGADPEFLGCIDAGVGEGHRLGGLLQIVKEARRRLLVGVCGQS